MAVSRPLLSALRVSFALVWCYSVYYDVVYQPRLGHTWYLYKLVMLTNLNFILTTVYSVLSALSSFKSLSSLQPATDFMLYTSVFPVGVITCALFWTLYLIEPELVMPAWVAKLIPSWLNHVTHTLPVFYLLCELFCSERRPPAKTTRLIMSSLFVIFYFGLILYIRAVDGYWLYPLLTLFEVEHFLLGYVAALVLYYALTEAARGITHLIWAESKKVKTK